MLQDLKRLLESLFLEATPVLYMPIAPSGAGKTTYYRKLKQENPRLEMFSLDALRHKLYDPYDYDRAFQMSTEDPTFRDRANDTYLEMLKKKQDLFVDATNLTPEIRKFYLDGAKKLGYKTVGVVFSYDLDQLIARQKTRGDKDVPEIAVRRQASSLIGPGQGEFDEIQTVPK